MIQIDNNKPFWLQIQFNNNHHLMRSWDITQEFDTLEEIYKFKSIIDHTVRKAQIVDAINKKIIDVWVDI